MLGILSVLNWLMAVLYGAGLGFAWLGAPGDINVNFFGTNFAFSGESRMQGQLVMTLLLVALAAPHVYLGLFIEKGRGRILQSILAVIALFAFPIGTAFGAFALWVCWSVEAELFESGVTREERRVRARRKQDDLDAETQELLDDPEFVAEHIPPPREGSPYAIAKQLVAEGASDQEVQAELSAQGLTDDEVETLMTTLGVRYTRRRASAPPPRRTTAPGPTKRPAIRKPSR
jgi:hypothetical protein